jgi:hypothetical protein
MTRRPSFQFYPADWRKETGLRLCSMGARGLWAEMLCLMHEGDPYGHLTYQGEKVEATELARLAGESPPAVKRWLKELEAKRVFSRTSEGVIYSRRMVRDEVLREKRAEIGRENGIKGAEYGQLGAVHGQKGGRPRKETGVENPHSEPGQKPPQNPRPSSSSSSAESSEDKSSGQSPAIDPVKSLFDLGVAILTDASIPEKEARSLVGKWRKQKTDAEVLTALLECRTQAISEPVEWLTKRLKSAKYVSATGYEYRGSLEDVIRESERRADWNIHWAAKTERDGSRKAASG